MAPPRVTHWLALKGLLLLTALAYAPLLTAGFVYEDKNLQAALEPHYYVEDNRGPWKGWDAERPQFRPVPRMLSNLTMRVQGWHLDSAREYHLVNLALHEVNGTLLWLLLLPYGVVPAFGATLVFLLHPIQVEAVSYVSARPDVLYGTAVLLMLLATRVTGWLGVLLVTLCGGLAVLAKESAVVIVGLLPVWLLYQQKWSARWFVPLSLWTVGGLFVAYRLFHIAGPGPDPWGALQRYTAPAPRGPFLFAATGLAALWRYLGLVLWPSGFSIDHDFDRVPPALAVVAVVATCAVLVWAWRARGRAPACLFAVCWVLIALSVRFVIPQPEYLSERHTMVPFLGLWIALAAGLSTLMSPSWKSQVLSLKECASWLKPSRLIN